jgi:two-component sensor histidine kinase
MARQDPDPDSSAQAGAAPSPSSGPESEQALREALEQRVVLLHELDHRVKNNLQLIASLMMMQIRRAADPAVRQALEGMLERLNAIAIVHRRLFETEGSPRFDAAAFVRDLVEELGGASHRDDISFELALEPVHIGLAKAAPLALMLNELLSNALRHAFPEGRAGNVRVGIVNFSRDFRIEICDDGVGMPETTSGREGFGRTIVDLLSRQLEAQVTWRDAQPGVCVEVVLPVDGDD